MPTITRVIASGERNGAFAVGGDVAVDEPAVEGDHHLLPRRDGPARSEARLEPALHALECEQVLLHELPHGLLLLPVALDEVGAVERRLWVQAVALRLHRLRAGGHPADGDD